MAILIRIRLYNPRTVNGGGYGTGFWALLIVAVVAALCAAYALLASAGLLTAGPFRTAARSTTGAPTEGTQRSEDTRSEDTPSTPAVEANTAAPEKTDAGTSREWVSAVGDSAMLGAVYALEDRVPNLVLVDAEGSRQAPAAIDLLRQYRADEHIGAVVVVHVGNNGPLTPQDFDEMMGELADARKVLVVNLTVPPDVPDPIAVPNDLVLAEGVGRYPDKAVLVDWRAASAGHPEYFWDGVHLTPRGAQAYAALIASQVGELDDSGPPPGPRRELFWGEGGTSGMCVGPPSWCRGVVRR